MKDRINTPLQGLIAIYPAVKAEIPTDPRIGLSMNGNDLELSLSSEDGLDGHEQFTVTARENDYRCVYFGMCDSAKKTFLDPRYEQEIDAIELIKKCKIYVIEKMGQTQPKRMGEKTGQKYSALFKIEQEETDDLNIFNSFLFFSRIFREKLASK